MKLELEKQPMLTELCMHHDVFQQYVHNVKTQQINYLKNAFRLFRGYQESMLDWVLRNVRSSSLTHDSESVIGFTLQQGSL